MEDKIVSICIMSILQRISLRLCLSSATDEFEKGCYHVNLENPENKKQFLVGSIHEHSKKGTAHVGARVLDMAEMHDDRLLRSEVISIAAIMARRMFRSYMVCQHYVPVCTRSHSVCFFY